MEAEKREFLLRKSPNCVVRAKQQLCLGLIILLTVVSKLAPVSTEQTNHNELKFSVHSRLPNHEQINSDSLIKNSTKGKDDVSSNQQHLVANKIVDDNNQPEALLTSSNNLQAFLALAPLASLAQQLNSQPALIGPTQLQQQHLQQQSGGLVLATSGQQQPGLDGQRRTSALSLGETQVAPATMSSSLAPVEPLMTADSKKKKKKMKKMKKKEKKMEKKHKEWKKGKKHKKKKYESKKKKGGMSKKKKG